MKTPKQLKINEKEILFLEIVQHLAHQFIECTEEEALLFSLLVMDKMDINKLRIR
jgi:hypothetical protein